MSTLPVLDIGPLLADAGGRDEVGRALDAACREEGFFYVVGHGLDPELGLRLERAARAFFGGALAEKQRIAMRHGGRSGGTVPLISCARDGMRACTDKGRTY